MSAPTTYTEASLAQYMADVLGPVGLALGLAAPDSYQEAVNETILQYGADTLSNAPDIRKVRALARVQAWQMVVSATAGDFDVKAADQTFSRSQVHAQALKNLEAARSDAFWCDPAYRVEREALNVQDPYRVTDED